MSEERKRVEHPSWCDPHACTASEFRPTDEEFREAGHSLGEHRSSVSVLPGFGDGRALQVFLSQGIAPWVCGTYLRFCTTDGNDSWMVEAGQGGGFPLYELLGQEVKERVREYPTLYAERFPYVQRAIEDEADEATADAVTPRDPVELEERLAAEQVDDERAEKGCTHPPDEACFGEPRRERPEPYEDTTLPPQLRNALKRMSARGKVVELTSSRPMPGSSYRLTVNAQEVTEGTLMEVKAAVADLVTRRLGAEPERVAEEAHALNSAFNSGAVAEALEERGQWFTVFDQYGEDPLRIRVTKEE